MVTREQVRAARAVRGWTVKDLAAAVREISGEPFSHITVSRYENGADSKGETLRRIRLALEREGFEFMSDGGRPGLRWDEDAPIRWAVGSDNWG